MMFRALVLVSVVLATGACVRLGPVADVDVSAPRRDDVCGELAQAFRIVAAGKARGESRQEQIEMARESVDNPFVSDRERTLGALLEIIDLVYASPGLGERDIEASIAERCYVNERGEAVVPRLWPVR